MRRSVELAKAARDEVSGLRHPQHREGDGGWPRPSGRTARHWPTARSTSAATACRSRSWRDWHRPRLEILADAGADVLALETVPDVDEAEALVGLVHEFGVPAWLSYTIAGTTTRAGQPLADAFAVAADVPEIVAVGVNCCAPADVEPAVAVARETTGKPVIVYPNSGEEWDGAAPNVDRQVAVVGRTSRRGGSAAGARIVGGCCRVRPDDIAELARRLARGLVVDANRA